ncbi:MAG: hypothetical protein HQM00_05430, partial [Magnetococcales bacterium]|nr:hypothetical protein [Magnetococcales bacterium]
MTALARHLEALFVAMRNDWLSDRLPRPDLTHLPLYREIGIALDAEAGGWIGSLEALRTGYEQGLAERDRLNHLPYDRRLWSPEARTRQALFARETYLERLLRLDAARDLAGVIQWAGQDRYGLDERIRAIVALLAAGRVQAAYILAMILANGGHQAPAISMALWAGGVVFLNPQEEGRGLEAWHRQMAGLEAEARVGLRGQLETLTALVRLLTRDELPEERLHAL